MPDDRPVRRRRARPVADAPVAALVAGADDLAREWLLALLAERPLAAAAEVPVAELAAGGPELCAAMVRALASDEELDRLDGGDLTDAAGRAGALAGAGSADAAAGAVELLRGVLWAGALAELRRPGPELVAGLAERLSAVAAVVTAVTLRTGTTRAPAREVGPSAPAPAEGEVRALDLRPRISDGPPLETVDRAVERHAADGRPLAVLLVELDGVQRLLAAQFGDEATAAIAQAEAAIEGLLRPGDAARRDGPGRIWVALAGTGPAGARALALRIGAGVARAAELSGAALSASVGVAVLGPDAPDGAALLDRAEESLFAARAGGYGGGTPPGTM
ncbi:diguanylate cyclase domain-containing protein [Capillimicrobium parvum]|uniref:GGDEF domain-containing protein n=1 Tax=Capillimicrobium parvum TaxID=2884022 RepID=A0A9E6XV70_9ACTN|nr:diguanylate cyclase [Capillimicrobium parvum]UGS34984.1 hypothetical protein DSM104329_01368 [Capillimicrobium parvum]